MSPDRTVDQVMLTIPKTLDVRSTVSTVRAALANDHVHMVLLVDGQRLLGAVTAADLPPAADPESPAVAFSSLRGRVVRPGRPVRVVMARMVATGRRRLAVVDDDHRLLGLLCLKRTLDGFCTDDGVRARAEERAQMASSP